MTRSAPLTRWREILFATSTTVLLFGLIELGLRVIGVEKPPRAAAIVVRGIDVDIKFPFMRPDRELFWSLEPRFRGKFLGKRVSINSHGFRGPEFTVPKTAGRTRVAFFGDSITFGYGVGDTETYVSSFGRLLERRGVEAMNCGVTGYTSYQVLGLLQRTAPLLDADLAFFCVGWNDASKRPVGDLVYAERIRWAMASEWLSDSFYLYRLVKNAYPRSLENEWEGAARRPRATLPEYRANLESIVAECRSRNILPLFIDLPRRKHPEEPLFQSSYSETIRQVGSALGVPIIDPGELGLKTPLDSNEPYFIDTLHFSPEGHAYLAERLAKALAEKGLL